MEEEVQAAEQETVTETVATEGTDPQTGSEPAETETVDVAELLEELKKVKGKLEKSVTAERNLRGAKTAAEEQLQTYREAEAAREAERVANLSLTEKLAEAQAARQQAERELGEVQNQWGQFRIETELESAGFLSGLEGDAKTAQLDTLRALTRLDLVKQDGSFSIGLFSERFGSMKPSAPAPVVTEEVKIVDLGGGGAKPAEQKATRFSELTKARSEAENRGNRMLVIRLDRELAQLQAGQ